MKFFLEAGPSLDRVVSDDSEWDSSDGVSDEEKSDDENLQEERLTDVNSEENGNVRQKEACALAALCLYNKPSRKELRN